MLEEHHQHYQAKTAERVHQAIITGSLITLQDIEDLVTLSRFSLLQTKEILQQLQESISQNLETSKVLEEINSDALVQTASDEIEAFLREKSTD